MKKLKSFLLGLLVGCSILTGCQNKEESFSAKDYSVNKENVMEVCIDVRDRNIAVLPSADNQIVIKYFENEKEFYDISLSDKGVLSMTTENEKEWTDYIGRKTSAEYRTISLYVPKNQLNTLKISTTNEDISLPEITLSYSIELNSFGGDIVFDKLDVGSSISISAKNGNISGSIIGGYDDFNISCDIKKGDSNLPQKKDDGEKTLNVSNNNGDIDIELVMN